MTKFFQNRWLRLAIFLASLIAISFALSHAIDAIYSHFELAPNRFFLPAYLIVFGISFLASVTIITPVHVALPIMVVAATRWDPWLVALSASLGGALGELSGYYAGYMGKRIASIQDMKGYSRIADWMNRNGVRVKSFK